MKLLFLLLGYVIIKKILLIIIIIIINLDRIAASTRTVGLHAGPQKHRHKYKYNKQT